MSVRRWLVGLFLPVVAFAGALLPGYAGAVDPFPFKSASETYFKLDVPNGTLSATVNVEFLNGSGTLSSLPVWILPAATDVVVKQDDATLQLKITPGTEKPGSAGIAVATLAKPLKPNLKTKLTATYNVPAHTGSLLRMEAGALELPFLGQGQGSFVFVDVPKDGENYFDPGCLVAADQPKDVKEAGAERWVCGDVPTIALSGDDSAVLNRCANLDDACRQRSTISVFSAYVQSITDETKRGLLEADLQMKDSTVHMVLRYFKQDKAWADKQWAVAQVAFPKLEATFGYAYPLKTVTMLQSHHLDIAGAAGIAFPTIGEVLLATDTGFDEEVTVHELAHQWAGFNLQSNWLWEGLAEYGMRTVAPELGVKPINRNWQRFPFKDPLISMYNGSGVFEPDYWYGKAGDFWFAYQAAIGGPDNMRMILSYMGSEKDRWPLDARWFMDRGESESGANLDKLFSDWVFNQDTSASLLAQRRTAHDLVKILTDRAATMGLSGLPSDIYDNLEAWVFEPIEGQLLKANGVLDSYAAVVKLGDESSLGQSTAVAKSWGKRTIAQTAGVVEDQRQAIQAIVDARRQLGDRMPDSAAKKLAEAVVAYGSGDYSGAKRLAADSLTAVFNEEASGKMIELAKAKQSSFKVGFLSRVGLFFKDPDGDLQKAESAYASGDSAGALKYARSAYDGWDGASGRGIQRLAMLMGLMCALSVGVWLLLKKLDGSSSGGPAKRVGEGHYLEPGDERTRNWRDWENTP